MALTYEQLKGRCDLLLAEHTSASADKQREVLKSEVTSLISEIGPVPVNGSITDMSVMIARVQGAKDRVSEIANDAQATYSMVDNIADMMVDAAMSAATQSSADKRKGEAAILACDYTIAQSKVESFYRFCVGSMKNLDSKHDALSRMITCIQLVANSFGRTESLGRSTGVGVDDQNRRSWSAQQDQHSTSAKPTPEGGVRLVEF
jgi:hypothetical protein